MLNNYKGFTLVELLVIIVILAILSTIGVMYYAGINAKARDSARRADLYEISIALEVNKTSSSYIPLQVSQFSSFQWVDPRGDAYCIASGSPPNPSNSSPWGNTCPSGFSPVAPSMPSGSFTSWKICTFLENPGSGNPNVFCKIQRQ